MGPFAAQIQRALTALGFLPRSGYGNGQVPVYSTALGRFAPGTGGGSGDVVGPASATDLDIAVFSGATGKLLADGGMTIAAVLAAASGWTMVSKTADESRASNTTMTVDSTLKFTMAANTKYRVRGVVFASYDSTNLIKHDINGPASPTYLGTKRAIVKAGGAAADWETFEITYANSRNIADGANGVITFESSIQNGANAGDYQFRWAQIVSGVTPTIVRAGSYLEWRLV